MNYFESKIPVSGLIKSLCEGFDSTLTMLLYNYDPDSCKRWGAGFRLGKGKNAIIVTWQIHISPAPERTEPWLRRELKEGDSIPLKAPLKKGKNNAKH